MSDDAHWRMARWFPHLSENTLSSLRAFHRELLKFNPRINLISRGTEQDADEIHVADAVAAIALLPVSEFDAPVYDLGSGNGVPGLILGILGPALPVRLVESDSRKVEFLKHVCHALKLMNVTPICARVENLPTGEIKVAINRGFASVDRALELLGERVAAEAQIYHLKGGGWREEIEGVHPSRASRWTTREIGSYHLPLSSVERTVVASTRRNVPRGTSG